MHAVERVTVEEGVTVTTTTIECSTGHGGPVATARQIRSAAVEPAWKRADDDLAARLALWWQDRSREEQFAVFRVWAMFAGRLADVHGPAALARFPTAHAAAQALEAAIETRGHG